MNTLEKLELLKENCNDQTELDRILGQLLSILLTRHHQKLSIYNSDIEKFEQNINLILLKKEDQMIKEFLLEKSRNNPTYGFKTLFGMLRNEGYPFNHKRVRRMYCDLKLNLKCKPKKRLAARTDKVLVVPNKPNEVWSLDYMSDALS